jgi:hypothetical protein
VTVGFLIGVSIVGGINVCVGLVSGTTEGTQPLASLGVDDHRNLVQVARERRSASHRA